MTTRETHFVTGGTGFVGGAIVLELLDRTDCDVLCLVRGADQAAANDRLHQALIHAADTYDRCDLKPAIAERTRAVAGDVTEPGCGLDAGSLPRVAQLWHVAASLKYEDRDAEEINRLNVSGTEQVIALARALGSPTVNYISTAYVAGRRTGTIRESVGSDISVANNVYERSKILAENIVVSSGLPYRILRPSIVIGHSRTCGATSFTGLYGFTSALLTFRLGVERALGGLLRHRGVMLLGEPDTETNFIPVDMVAANAVSVALSDSPDRVFHLTNGAAPTFADSVRTLFRWAALRDPVFVTSRGLLTSIDLQLDQGLEFYSSYIRNGKSFERSNTDAVCGAAASMFPIDEAELTRFFDWYGRRIRQDGRTAAPARQPFSYRADHALHSVS